MAYFLNQGSKARQEQFIVETIADVANLPTMTTEGDSSIAVGESYQKVMMGSIALCVETGEFYILNSNNVWSKVGG